LRAVSSATVDIIVQYISINSVGFITHLHFLLLLLLLLLQLQLKVLRMHYCSGRNPI